MGIFSTLFSSSKTLENITDAVINTGDKLYLTDEERLDIKLAYAKQLPLILKGYEPFKIAQRYLAFWFAFLFGLSFLTGLIMTIANIFIKYNALSSNLAIEKIVFFDIDPLFNLVGAFSLGIIMISIVSFYFGAGVIESFKRKQ